MLNVTEGKAVSLFGPESLNSTSRSHLSCNLTVNQRENHKKFFWTLNMIRYSRVINIASTFLLLGALYAVFYNGRDNIELKSFFIGCQKDVGFEGNNGSSSHDVSSLPRCQQNMNASNILGFGSLSRDIQDFLYYRHCRHFPMILDLPDKCGSSDEPEDIFLLIVIKSSPANFERRELLRKTWAKERQHRGLSIRRIFISGTLGTGFERKKNNKILALEHQEHNDILQWDFNDSFFNLTLKQILFLEWMERHCLHARFLLNGDDDVFAHTDNIVEYLQSLRHNNTSKHLFTGHLITNANPIRWAQSKYFAPVQVHEPNHYPPYCGGGGYLLSGYTALVIYIKSMSIPIFHIDDVYMGMCLEAAKLVPESHPGVKTLDNVIPSKQEDKFDPCYVKQQLLIHKFSPIDLYVTWHKLHSPRLQCNVTV
ncbi:N-acetyllactosaminide beta-1,3-N-acetylglucosaminyltransferase 3-like [Odontesthes bonariensis]|uniref:N-acetyllactosaminide beta-1,3-N-acetylglucosaminyltransferase 3-like n=1 Tax=Odontesthes bonariensis TaxID=219752 RepID=UPI003F58169E